MIHIPESMSSIGREKKVMDAESTESMIMIGGRWFEHDRLIQLTAQRVCHVLENSWHTIIAMM